MLTVKMIKPSQKLSIILAVVFAREVLHIFEDQYPEDKRPRKAIEAAELYLASNTIAAAYAARDAAYVAREAANVAANVAARDAAYAAVAVAAAYVAREAANSAANVVFAFYATTHYAAKAKQTDKAQYIHEMLLTMLPQILQFKIENKESFGDLDSVWEYLSDADREAAVYHLDHLKLGVTDVNI